MVEIDVHSKARQGVPLRLLLYTTPFPVSRLTSPVSDFNIRYSIFLSSLSPFAFHLSPFAFFPTSSSPRSPLDPLKGESPARRSIYEVHLLSPVSRLLSPTSIFDIQYSSLPFRLSPFTFHLSPFSHIFFPPLTP